MQANLSLKALGVGVGSALLVSLSLALLAPYYLIPVYDLAAKSSPHHTLHHPLVIAVMLLTCILQVGIPGYVAAWVADRGFIIHSVVVAVVYLALSFAFGGDVIAWTPRFLLLGITVSSLLAAMAAGYLRQWQRRGTRESL